MMPVQSPKLTRNHAFPDIEKQGVYNAIYQRRDVRSQFLPDAIPDELLHKLLDAAHHAGSVGFMQPWSFIVVRSGEIKQEIKHLFEQANERAAADFEGERRAMYSRLKLEGILESPVNICVTSDPARHGPHVLGRHTIRETDIYSTCCAIQNLWLAARAEGIGLGWVSILDPAELRTILQIPEPVIPVAYLCLGYVTEFLPQPELESIGWLSRVPVKDLIFYEQWGKKESR